jgi:hypothetical protein
LELPEKIFQIPGDHWLGELYEGVSAGVVDREQLPGFDLSGNIVVQPELRSRIDLEWDILFKQSVFELVQNVEDHDPAVVIASEEPMGSADHPFNTVLQRQASHGQALLPFGRTVVDSGENVVVEIEHTSVLLFPPFFPALPLVFGK